MDSVIQRLWASKAQHMKTNDAEGRTHGAEWARSTADYGQLKALSKIDDEVLEASEDPFELFVRAYSVGEEIDLDEASREVIDLFGDDGNAWDEAYARGFIRGAVEVFNAVKDKL